MKKKAENKAKTMEIEVEISPDTWITKTVPIESYNFTMATETAFEILTSFKDKSKTNFAVYMVLLKHRNAIRNRCFPSIETIANKTSMSIKTVKRALDELEEKGFIRIDSGMRGISNNYYFPKEWFYDLFEQDYKQIKANRRKKVMKTERVLKAEKELEKVKEENREKDRKIASLEKQLKESQHNFI